MENFSIIFLCLTLVALGVAFRFKDCGSKGARLTYVGVTPCDNDAYDPCILSPDKIYEIKVQFMPKINSTKATTRFSIITMGSTYTFPDRDACGDIKCPIIEGIKQTIAGNMTGDPSYPKPEIDFKWEVLDENLKVFFCFVIPFKIKN